MDCHSGAIFARLLARAALLSSKVSTPREQYKKVVVRGHLEYVNMRAMGLTWQLPTDSERC